MFESIINFFKNMKKTEKEQVKSKDAAKERLHLVLMQDRANVSADFLDLMKQEIIEVIKKYIDVDENAIDVRLTNKANGDGTTGAPALYANIPIVSIKEEVRNKMARQEDVNKKEEEKDTNEEIENEKGENIEISNQEHLEEEHQEKDEEETSTEKNTVEENDSGHEEENKVLLNVENSSNGQPQ